MISTHELTKRFGDRSAVEALTFTAPAGAVTGFLGPNGAGKTTTFRMVLGLATPTSGTALIDGVAYAQLAQPRRSVGAVLEASGFHPARSGRNHLRVICVSAGFSMNRADELLGLVGLDSAAGRRVGGYSMGMRQRLALATALLGDPPVIVLDEPTNGLDPEGVAWLRTLCRKWAAEGRCVVIASHLLAEVAQAVDRLVVISAGRVVEETTVKDILASEELHVRCSNPVALATALSNRGADVEVADDLLRVRGCTAEEVGDTATNLSLSLYSLSVRTAGEALEDRFLRLTSVGAPSPDTSAHLAGQEQQ